MSGFQEISLQVFCASVIMICVGWVMLCIIFLLKTEKKDTVVIKNKYICIQFVVSYILAARCFCRYRGTGVRAIS